MKRLKNEAGFSLIGVMVVVMILSVLGLSLVTLSLGSVNISARERDDQSVFYIAEAGITYEMAKIETEIESIYESTNSETDFFDQIETTIIKSEPENSSLNFDELFGEKPIVKFQIEQLNNENPRNYKITSVGIIERDNQEKQRTLSQEFVVEWTPKGGGVYVPEEVLFVRNTIELNNGHIDGDIGTISNEEKSVKSESGWPTVNGSVYVPYGSENTALYKHHAYINIPNPTGREMKDFPELPPFPVFPELPLANDFNRQDSLVRVQEGNLTVISSATEDVAKRTYKLSQSRKFKNITLDANSKLYFDIGSSNIDIVVDQLNLINGHINIIGSGNLNIYVNEKITFGSSSTINDLIEGLVNEEEIKKWIKKLGIYLKKPDNLSSQQINFGGSQRIYGSLYAEKADIDLGAGAGIQGNIFTGGTSFKVSGGSWATAPLIFAPNALFQHTNGTIKGAIIADSYKMDGGAQLIYQPLDFNEGPISGEGINNNQNNSGSGPNISKKPIIQD